MSTQIMSNIFDNLLYIGKNVFLTYKEIFKSKTLMLKVGQIIVICCFYFNRRRISRINSLYNTFLNFFFQDFHHFSHFLPTFECVFQWTNLSSGRFKVAKHYYVFQINSWYCHLKFNRKLIIINFALDSSYYSVLNSRIPQITDQSKSFSTIFKMLKV